MASIGTIGASLISGISETTVALAKLNFDFSLIKVNAPIEFEGVGSALSHRRRESAETGIDHITARKLGALFEGLIPQTPRLYRSYGHRASEVSNTASGQNAERKLGLFTDFSGPDATSLWAAATSGRAAIAVHLLACLLARFWESEEAVSIWEEIVDARRSQLTLSTQEDTFPAASVLASQIAVTRAQLAQWDNSARSWLRYADRIREIQQTKLRLVVDELNQIIPNKSSLYESVIDTWITALLGVEELLGGSSQRIAHGGVILALSSWHLYPDLSVHGNAPILQNDDLFPRGTVAYLHMEGSPKKLNIGISWSLAMSHLRYYGTPIVTERGYATDSSRITFPQFLVTVLGSLSWNWGLKSSATFEVARLIDLMNQRLPKAPTWLDMLHVPAKALLESRDTQRQLYLKLFRVGRDRGASVLGYYPKPAFGLTDIETFFKFLKDPVYASKLSHKYTYRTCSNVYLPECRKATRSRQSWSSASDSQEQIDLADVIESLENMTLDLACWFSQQWYFQHEKSSSYYSSLCTLALAWGLYRDLDSATIDPAVLSKPVLGAAWASNSVELISSASTVYPNLPLQDAFACIAHFEKGGIELQPSDFAGVMAISNADSIYVAGPLLVDPIDIKSHNKIFRIDGNVGKPGLVLMVPPTEPMIRQPDPDSWRVIDRDLYISQTEDCFVRTSLHLSFTDWSVPLNTGKQGRGLRSVEATAVETLVSVIDNGRWVADLDILDALQQGCDQLDNDYYLLTSCQHDLGSGQSNSILDADGDEEEIICIKTWEEFLDRPNSPAVLLACDNWEARLAAAAAGVARGDRVFLGRGQACRNCLSELIMFGEPELVNKALFII